MLTQLLVDLQNVLAGESGLNITTILGYPNTGRTEPTLPMGSVVFQRVTYNRQPNSQAFRQRLGQTQPIGVSVDVMVYIFASNEYSLLALCDLLSAMRADVSSVTSETVKWSVSYGDVVRSEFAGATVEERFLAYVAECQFTLSRT